MKSIKAVPTAISSASSYLRDAASRLGFKGSLEVSVTATRIPKLIPERPSTPSAIQSATKLSSVSVEPYQRQVQQPLITNESSRNVTIDSATGDNDQRQAHLDNFESAMTEWMKKDEESSDVMKPVIKKDPQKEDASQDTDSILSQFGSDNGDGNDESTTAVSVPKAAVTSDVRLTRSAVHSKARSLIKILSSPTLSTMNQRLRLQELSKHLITYPDACGSCIKSGAIPVLLRLRERSEDKLLIGQSRQVLSLLGYADPPKVQGIRILSIDGGGIRGVVILEILRKLQKSTGQPIHEMFDLICGVSTGAILAMLFGPLKADIDTCESHYRMVSKNLFVSDFWGGTQRLIMTHAYYDAKKWEAILKRVYGEDRYVFINYMHENTN